MTVKYINRYTQKTETEAIYKEKWLRWAYDAPLGRLAKHAALKRPLFSKFYGWSMKRPSSRKKVTPFIQQYKVDETEFLAPAETFKSFNDFFIRRLLPEARPINQDPTIATLPADGRHLGFQNLDDIEGIYAKGQFFKLDKLLANKTLANHYAGGTLVISRLCPSDYHRFHFPVSGTPNKPKIINGKLFSVNPIALSKKIKILWQNKRCITTIDSDHFGQVLMLEIGATCVGSIKQTAPTLEHCNKGDEKGYFEFGGSMTILIFEKDRIQLANDLVESTEKGIELYAKMGDVLGKAIDT